MSGDTTTDQTTGKIQDQSSESDLGRGDSLRLARPSSPTNRAPVVMQVVRQFRGIARNRWQAVQPRWRSGEPTSTESRPSSGNTPGVRGSAETTGRAQNSQSEYWRNSLQWLIVLMALLASTIFIVTDADGGRRNAAIITQLGLEFAGVAGLTLWMTRVHLRNPGPSESELILPILLCVVVLSLLWEPFQRWFLLSGRPFEMMIMHSQRCLMLAAVVFSFRISCQRLTVLIGVTICILCAAITREPRVYWLIGGYAAAAVTWMIASHWSTLRGRLLHDHGKGIPVRWLIAAPVLALLVVSISVAGGSRTISTMKGLLPGSGGDGEYDPFSRDGVNDGDALVAGTDHIRSFAPIDDAPFAEDDKPSLYDVFNDAFDEPVRRNREQDRSIALSPELRAEIEVRMAKSGEAGREFSTHRRAASADRRRIGNMDSPALLYVAGRVPVHLRMEIYDLFDGVSWYPRALPDSVPGMAVLDSQGKPWLRIPCHGTGLGLHTYSETHAVKICNLRSPVIPSPPDLRSLHIDRVDQVDMFGWHTTSILKMNRKAIPEFTVIHLLSDRIDYRRLPGNDNLTFVGLPEKTERQLPSLREMDFLRTLANDWTEGVPAGYRQAVAVCDKLRKEYILDRNFQMPDDCESPVTHFLAESRRGSDYQFATAAAIMLRTLGFSTRLVSGFYATDTRYDARKQHTPVSAEDAHFWCELYVGSGVWVTLDPSPGYHILGPPPGIMERLWSGLVSVLQNLRTHWMISLISFLTAGVLLWNRHGIADLIISNWMALQSALQSAGDPRRHVLQTVSLLDGRLRRAGLKRPAGQTFCRWVRCHPELIQLCPEMPGFLRSVEWAAFSSAESACPSGSEETQRCCREARTQLTFRRCRETERRFRSRCSETAESHSSEKTTIS